MRLVDRASRRFWPRRASRGNPVEPAGSLGRRRESRATRPSAKAQVLGALMAMALVLSGCSLTGSNGGVQPTSGSSERSQSMQSALPTQSVQPAQATPSEAGPAVPAFSHVFVIMMENKTFSEVIGSPTAPYINNLASQYGLADRYYEVVHHSLPNYLAILSGSTQGAISGDCVGCSFSGTNLVDQLEQNGKTWKAYMESMPQPCYNGNTASPSPNDSGSPVYVRRHNPFMYFKDITDNPARCDNVVPLSQFTTDLQKNSLPDFVWVTPNLLDNMHDGTVRQGDTWLSTFVPQILASPAWKNGGVLFIVWDESDPTGVPQGSRHTIALVVAPNAKPGYKSQVTYDHYSLLRTIEEAWGLGFLGHSGDAGTKPMIDFFK